MKTNPKSTTEPQVPQARKIQTFYIDGAGARPDGTGSGFGWVSPESDETRVKWEDDLTNNVAEYRAMVAILRYVSDQSRLVVLTDSMLVCEQFNRRWACRDPDLQILLHRARKLIEEKALEVEVKWISRTENLAGHLLDRLKYRLKPAVNRILASGGKVK